MEKKEKASIFAIFSVLILAILKFIIGFYSNSIAVLSSALDNFQDILISSLNFFAIRKASMPPDKNHSYGHGKVEDISAFFESLIISATGIYIVYKAFLRFFSQDNIKSPELAIFIMLLSLLWSLIISYYLKKTGEKTGSPALKADSLHYKSDVYSNGGAIIGIILSYYFNLKFFDPLIGIIIGIIVLYSSFPVFKEGLLALTDSQVDYETRKIIDNIINDLPYPYAGYHKLRTRSSGGKKYIDFHLLVCRKANLEYAHNLSEIVEKEIENNLKNTDVTTHLEPCPFLCKLTADTCRAIKMGIVKWKTLKNS